MKVQTFRWCVCVCVSKIIQRNHLAGYLTYSMAWSDIGWPVC